MDILTDLSQKVTAQGVCRNLGLPVVLSGFFSAGFLVLCAGRNYNGNQEGGSVLHGRFAENR